MPPTDPPERGVAEVVVPPAPATRVEPVVDVLHGVEVPDPYRWLEAGDDAEVAAWVAAQDERTRVALDALPGRAGLRRRLEARLRAPVSGAPRLAGERAFTVERWGHHDRALLVHRPAGGDHPGPSGAAPTVLVDPAELAGDPVAAIDWYHPSPEGDLVAVGTSTGGDEQSTLHVVEVATGRVLGDTIPRTRAASVAWLPDASGFAYTRYPDPDDGDDAHYGRHVRQHRLGEDPADDPVLWDRLPDPTAWPDVWRSRDGRWLLVHVAVGWTRTDVHLHDGREGTWRTVIEGADALTGFRVVGERLVGTTTLGADRGRVVAAPLDDPRPERWATLVPEGEAVIEAVAATAGSLLVWSTHRAVSRLHRHHLDGSDPVEVPLPGTGALSGLSADPDGERALLTWSSFTTPPALFRWQAPERAPGAADAADPGAADPAGGELRRWSRLPGATTVADHVVGHERYRSPDGTEASLFTVRHRHTEPSPTTPTVLTGYGGFGVTLGPDYSPVAAEVVDSGGQWAVAGIRGGAEEGEAWHRAGMREHKERSFDDFAAAADHLVATGRTSRERLAIRGGSNGGLLVGATLTRRPDLCRAVHCAVPLLDMVLYPRFLIARLWVPEYGDPDVAEELAWLWAYSPYHRVVDGTCYPATLITTGEGDSRVDPAHARKMAARLQAATSSGERNPVLLRVERRAGHGQGKPVGQQAEEAADVLAFLGWQLGWPVDGHLGGPPTEEPT